jgi:hypothetical protein
MDKYPGLAAGKNRFFTDVVKRIQRTLVNKNGIGGSLISCGALLERALYYRIANHSVDRPIFIIGAPRSGTTILYKVLIQHDDLAYLTQASDLFHECPIIANKIFRLTGMAMIRPDPVGLLQQWAEHGFEYAEGYNFWWRFSNSPQRFVLGAEDVTEEQRFFYKWSIARHQFLFERPRFVNKAPINSLRIGYLNEIFPDSLFIHIYRDGRAVARSILERRIRQGSPYADWGPRPYGWSEIQKQQPLLACGLQWKHILEHVQTELASIPLRRQMSVSYESFVNSPRETLVRLLSFCQLAPSKAVLDMATSIRNMNFKWQDEFVREEIVKLETVIGDALSKWGYVLSGAC